MTRINSLQIGIVGCCLLVGVSFGCRFEIDPNAAIAKANETNIQRLANLYFTFQMKNRWQGPKDEEQFKKFLKSYSRDKLTRIGINPDSIDELFVNERDGEPFKIRYSVRGSAMGSSEPVVFESTGVDGARMVGFLNMEQREVDESEYNDLWEGKATPQQPSQDNSLGR
jgi:hypothetical protein